MFVQFIDFISADVSHTLGWTIIHSFWQVSLIALITSAIHKVYDHHSSAFKFNVSIGSVMICIASSIYTFMWYYFAESAAPNGQAITPSITIDEIVTPQNSEYLTTTVYGFIAENLHHVNAIWIAGISIFTLRFIASYLYINYLRSTSTALDKSNARDILTSMISHFKITKPIKLMESEKINVPMVLGHLKPIILFPVGMVTMLTTAELEAIITHELHHIKRHDYIINIGLTLVEILYFFHPAMWWISANIKSERENCCDDAAINNIDSIQYARVLVKLEEMKNARTPALAMPFVANKHQLLNRIKRILNMKQTKNDIREKSVATILLLFAAILFASNTNSQMSNKSTLHTDTSVITDSKDNQGGYENHDEIYEVPNDAISLNDIVERELNSVEVGSKLQQEFSSDHDRFSILIDTLPQNNQITISTEKNGKKIEITKENGKIKHLKINGKEIPESEYPMYQNDIDAVFNGSSFDISKRLEDFDMENLFEGKSMDSLFSNSFGMIFDGEDWREFGGNIEQFLENDVFDKMQDMEGLRNFDFEKLEDLEGLEGFEGLKDLEGLKGLEELKGLENLEEFFENMGIQMDSTIKMYHFDTDGINGFQEMFDGFEFFNDENTKIMGRDELFGSQTVVDKIGNALNKDGLLEEYKINRIELSGKHLKINGDKMPKALFNKYKNMYQEETGAPLTKKSKMIFEIEGKPSKRKVRTF